MASSLPFLTGKSPDDKFDMSAKREKEPVQVGRRSVGMKVSVMIQSNLTKNGGAGPPVEVELENGKNTLQDVLERVSARYSDLELIQDGRLTDDLCELLINGEDYLSFPEGLKKNLNEGDAILVDIYLTLLSGG
jgi:hypothetical protein